MITEEIEEGQYSFDGCYYQAKRSNYLKRHKIIKHPTMNESESKEALENTYRDTEASSIVKDCEVEIEDDVVEDDVLEDDTDDEYYVKTNTV